MDAMSAAAQFELASDIDALGDVEQQAARRGNGSVGRNNAPYWTLPPNIERARAAHLPKAIEEAAKIEPPAPIVYVFSACEVTSYSELIGAIRQKVAALGVRYLDFDSLADWAPGLTGKIFGAAQAKHLGPHKLFDALRAAGLRIRIEDDPEQTAKMKRRIAENFNPRQANQARPNRQNYIQPSEQLIERVLKHLSNSRGGLRRLNRSVKEARSNIVRRGHATRRQMRERGPSDFATQAAK